MRPQKAGLFWEYLVKENKLLYKQVRYLAINDGDIVIYQPSSMSDASYHEYKRILNEWLGSNEL